MSADRTNLPPIGPVDYSHLFRCLAEPAFLVDPERGAILDASDAAAQMLQYSRTELLGLTVADRTPSRPTASRR